MVNLLASFAGNPPATPDSIGTLEKEAGLSLPLEYRSFLLEQDGGEGFIGDGSYLILWSIGELLDFNRDYEVANYCPEVLLIGSSGGGEAFGLDFNLPEVPIVQVPFVGMDPSVVEPVAGSFSEFLQVLAKRSQ